MEKTGLQDYLRGFIPFASGAFLVGITGGFTAVLGPAFVTDMGLPYNNTAWTALAMAVSTAALAPVFGKLGDALGRRTMLLAGVGIFTLGNVMSAAAGSLGFMMLARFVVGMGSAAIAPVVMSYIVVCFPQDKVARGFALYMLISSGAVIFGPSLGGLIIRAGGWRAMMWLCSGISLVILGVCGLTGRGQKEQKGSLEGFDWAGSAAALVFFGLVLCIPAAGQNVGWSSGLFYGVCVGAVVFLAVLCYAEKRAANPVIQWDFIKRRVFVLSIGALFLTQGLMQANMTNVIVFVNYTQPENGVISGYAISIMYVGMSLGAAIIGPLADRAKAEYVLVGSLALTGAGCGLLLLFTENASVLLLGASLGLLGFGLGGNGTIFLKVVLSGVPAGKAGSGTGTYGLFRDLAAPFGVTVFVPLFANRAAALAESGMTQAAAAVGAVRMIGIAEILCVAAGIVLVLMLPGLRKARK